METTGMMLKARRKKLGLTQDELAQRAGAKLKHVGGSWRSACPLHGGHNDSGFAIYTKEGRQLWQCFSGDCGGGCNPSTSSDELSGNDMIKC